MYQRTKVFFVLPFIIRLWFFFLLSNSVSLIINNNNYIIPCHIMGRESNQRTIIPHNSNEYTNSSSPPHLSMSNGFLSNVQCFTTDCCLFFFMAQRLYSTRARAKASYSWKPITMTTNNRASMSQLYFYPVNSTQ